MTKERQQIKGSTLNGKSSRQYTWTQAFNRTPDCSRKPWHIGPDDETQDMSGQTIAPAIHSPVPNQNSSSNTQVNTEIGEIHPSGSGLQPTGSRTQPFGSWTWTSESRSKSRKQKWGISEATKLMNCWRKLWQCKRVVIKWWWCHYRRSEWRWRNNGWNLMPRHIMKRGNFTCRWCRC